VGWKKRALLGGLINGSLSFPNGQKILQLNSTFMRLVEQLSTFQQHSTWLVKSLKNLAGAVGLEPTTRRSS
jgi:hypothetical protein